MNGTWKDPVFAVIVVFVIALYLYINIVGGINITESKQITVGPHRPFTVGVGYKYDMSIEDTYTFVGDNYFELEGPGSSQQPSALEPPQVGQVKGQYWIRNISLGGTWQVTQASASIYSLKPAHFTITPKLETNIVAVLLLILTTTVFGFAFIYVIGMFIYQLF